MSDSFKKGDDFANYLNNIKEVFVTMLKLNSTVHLALF